MVGGFRGMNIECDSMALETFAESKLYQEFLLEKEEILKHKWIESEKQGVDIGLDVALLDWVHRHRQNWKSGRG